MDRSQNTLAVIFTTVALTYSHVGKALRMAGWAVRSVDRDDADAIAGASMMVVDGQDQPPLSPGNRIVAVIIEGGLVPSFPVDLVIDANQGIGPITEIFSQWLPPDVEILERVEAMLGREGLWPVVQGLRAELQRAVDGADGVDAHKMAGLAGTLGFAAVSASWQAVDQGTGDAATARRDSRTALVVIDRWLAEAP
jgi:hypothetical protein